MQSIKAGILEIADVYVVNKADLSGAEKARRLIQDAVAMAPKKPWQPPILLASAVKEEGIGPVWEAIESHRAFLRQSGGLEERRRERLKQEVIALVAESAREDARRAVEGDTPVGRLLRDNRNGRLNPYSLAADVRAMRPAHGAEN